jgi:hypothetical protein
MESRDVVLPAPVCHFHSRLIFTGQAGAYNIEASPFRHSTLMVGSKPCPQVLEYGGSEWQQ